MSNKQNPGTSETATDGRESASENVSGARDARTAPEGSDGHTAAPDGLREQYAAAIHRYDYEHGLSGNDIPSEHHRGEADAVLAVRDREMEQLRAELERQVDAKVGVAGEWGNALADKTMAEAAIARVRQAIAERRAEVTEFEAESEPSAWSDAVTVTCLRIEDSMRAFPPSVGVRYTGHQPTPSAIREA